MHPFIENSLFAGRKQLAAIFGREPKPIGQPVNNIAEADLFVC